MQRKSRVAATGMFAIVAVLALGATASAATFRGVVVHKNTHAHSFVLAGAGGRLAAVHARHLPPVGRAVSVTVRRLRNGTWLAQRLRTGRVQKLVRLRGTVSYVDPVDDSFVVSARGASLVVHRGGARRHGIRLATDSGLEAGDVVTVEGAIDGDSVDASRVQASPAPAPTLELEGTVQQIDLASRILTVSADDSEQSRGTVNVLVPATFDLGLFTPGESVELTVSRGADGSYTLLQSSNDSNARAADSLEEAQGADHGGHHAQAEQECAAQAADPGFAAAHGGLSFTEFYERNPDDAGNAFGRCVNLLAHQKEAQRPSSGGSGSTSSDSEAKGGTSEAASAGSSGADDGTQGSTSSGSGNGSDSTSGHGTDG